MVFDLLRAEHCPLQVDFSPTLAPISAPQLGVETGHICPNGQGFFLGPACLTRGPMGKERVDQGGVGAAGRKEEEGEEKGEREGGEGKRKGMGRCSW